MATSTDYLLLQVHIGLVRRISIFVIHLREYSFLYMTKYVKCVFMKYLVIVTTWCGNTQVQPNPDWRIGVPIPGNSG